MNPQIEVWQPNFNYTKDTIVQSPVGAYATGVRSLVQATFSFVSGASFSAANWNRLADVLPAFGSSSGTIAQGNDSRLSDQRPPSDIAVFQTTHAYAKGELALSPLGQYTTGAYTLIQAIAAFTSTGSFSSANWLAIGTLANYNPTPMFARTPSGYYAPAVGMVSTQNIAISAGGAGIINFLPVELTPGVTYDKFGQLTTVAASGGTTALLCGLYADTGRRAPDTAAGPLVTASIDLSSGTGTKSSGAISYTPTRVLHWAAALWVETVAPTTRPTVRCVNSTLKAADTTPGGATTYGYTAGTTGQYSALPTGAVTLTDYASPMLCVPHAA